MTPQALRLEQLDMTFKAIASGVEEIETIERQVHGYLQFVCIIPRARVIQMRCMPHDLCSRREPFMLTT